jgi:hypothetical protein
MLLDQLKVERGVYVYCFNGLCINSEVKLPEIVETTHPGPGLKSVSIRYGNAPRALEHAHYNNPVLSIASAEVLVHIEHTARYYVRNSDTVVVDPYPGAPEDAVRLYILSIVLGVLLHKNSIMALHASCVQVNGGAVLIAGPSGAGKSTLALGLYRKGYPIVNDDISSVYFDGNNVPYIYPGVQHLKLWAHSLEKYGYSPGSFDKLRDELNKFSFPIDTEARDMLPLKAIYFIGEHNENRLENNVVESAIGKIRKVKANTYRYKLVEHLQQVQRHFMQTSLLSDKVRFFNVKRPPSVSPSEFADYMEQQFLSL